MALLKKNQTGQIFNGNGDDIHILKHSQGDGFKGLAILKEQIVVAIAGQIFTKSNRSFFKLIFQKGDLGMN